jgi:hypothetical protein
MRRERKESRSIKSEGFHKSPVNEMRLIDINRLGLFLQSSVDGEQRREKTAKVQKEGPVYIYPFLSLAEF